MIDWEWAGVTPPKLEDRVSIEYDDAVVFGNIVSFVDSDGDDTEDGEMAYVAVVELDSGGFDTIDFSHLKYNNLGNIRVLN